MNLLHLFFLLCTSFQTKNYSPHWFICFICTRLFGQSIWSSFIYSFFCARPFDQKLGSPLFYFFYLHTTIRPTYLVLFHLFFLLCSTIRPNIRALIGLFLLFAHDHPTNVSGPLLYILPFCTNIRPKIRALINLFLLFVHDHLTKIRGHSYSLIHYFLNCANISYAIFMIVLPLYSWKYCTYISYTIFMTIWRLSPCPKTHCNQERMTINCGKLISKIEKIIQENIAIKLSRMSSIKNLHIVYDPSPQKKYFLWDAYI